MNARPPQLAAVRAWTLHRRRAGGDLRLTRPGAPRFGAVRELRFGAVAVRAELLCEGGMLRFFAALPVKAANSDLEPEEVGEELLRLHFSQVKSLDVVIGRLQRLRRGLVERCSACLSPSKGAARLCAACASLESECSGAPNSVGARAAWTRRQWAAFRHEHAEAIAQHAEAIARSSRSDAPVTVSTLPLPGVPWNGTTRQEERTP